ncbi:MAG TPA: hypothetical protein VGG68_01570, partial [Caulobacteraceae bacterium]
MAVLSSLKALVLTVFDGPPEPPAKPDPKVVKAKAKSKPTAPELKFSDLEINDPADALRALARATRVPPHQRHLDRPIEENMGSYAHHVETMPSRTPQPELKAVERSRRDLRPSAAGRTVASKDSSAA